MNVEVETKWRIVEGHLLEVSNDGRLRHLISKDEITCSDDGNGYLWYRYTAIGGFRHALRVHRMVAEAFLGVQKGKGTVRHKNANTHDNRVENLAYVSMGDSQVGKLKGIQVLEIRRLKKEGWSYRKLAGAYDVSIRTIQKIINRETWKYL